METTRQQKFSRLIQKELSLLFQNSLKEYVGKAFVSVTVVRAAPDLGLCKVYLSIMMVDPQELCDSLNNNVVVIRKELGTKIRNQVRHVPQIKFYVDDTMEEATNINKIINDLNIPKEDEE